MVTTALAVLLAAAATQGAPTLQPCAPQGVAARCGTVAVPEDGARPGGRTIRLHVVVIPARRQPAPRDAFTYLAGGPGGAAATEMPFSAVSIWPEVHERRDIVLVDQRGTGGSNPLECPVPRVPLVTDAQVRAFVAACLKVVPGNPAHYGTRAAADDLEAVRRALRYRSFDVYGTSYGATVAQVYLARHPGSVRTLVLDGGTFLDVPFFGRFAANGERALRLVERRCAAERACARAFPRWRAQLDRLIAGWNAKPVTLPGAGRLDGDGLAGVVQELTLNASTAATIPLLVSRAAAGDYRRLAPRLGVGGPPLSLMFWTIWCNEPWVGLGSLGPWPGYLAGYTDARLGTFARACRFVPKRAEPRAAWGRPASRKPVLALVGEADPQDPAANLPGFRRALPNGRIVVAPGQGHAVGQVGCLGRLVGRFVERGSARNLDASCARRIEPPPFVLR